MVYTLDEIKKRITPVAQKYSIPTVWVFGSYARGEATEDSDIDLLFQREGSTIVGWMIGAFYEDLRESLGKELDLVTEESLSQHTDRRGSKRFAENLFKERKMLYKRFGYAAH